MLLRDILKSVKDSKYAKTNDIAVKDDSSNLIGKKVIVNAGKYENATGVITELGGGANGATIKMDTGEKAWIARVDFTVQGVDVKDSPEDEIKELEKLRDVAKKNGEESKVNGYTIQINRLLSMNNLLSKDGMTLADKEEVKKSIAVLESKRAQAKATGKEDYINSQIEKLKKSLEEPTDTRLTDSKTKDAFTVQESKSDKGYFNVLSPEGKVVKTWANRGAAEGDAEERSKGKTPTTGESKTGDNKDVLTLDPKKVKDTTDPTNPKNIAAAKQLSVAQGKAATGDDRDDLPADYIDKLRAKLAEYKKNPEANKEKIANINGQLKDLTGKGDN